MHNSSSQPIDRLCTLLNVSERLDSADHLTIEHLQTWKPMAEKIARGHQSEALEIAELLEGIAYESEKIECIAFAWWIVGNIHHNLGDNTQAHVAYSQSEQFYRELGDTLNVARMSIGWVHVLGEMAQYEESLRRAEEAEKTLASSDTPADKRRLALLQTNKGIVYEQLGRLLDALECYQRKLHYFNTLPEQNLDTTVERAMGLNDIGFLQLLLGQYVDADESFRSALKLLSFYSSDPDIRPDITLIKMNQALLAVLRQSTYHIVRKAFQQARDSRAQLAPSSATYPFAQIDLGEANWLLRNGHIHDVDGSAIERLYALTSQAGMEFESAYAQLLLGQLDYYRDRLESAYQRFERLCREAANKTPTFVYLAHLWQSRVLRQMNQLQQAEDLLLQAIRLIEGSIQQITLDSYRAGYLEDKLIAYHDLIDLYLHQGQYEAALLVVERSKARTLAEMMAAQRGPPPAGTEGNPSHVSWSIQALTSRLPPKCLVISYAVVRHQVWAFLLDQQGFVVDPIRVGQCPERSDVELELNRIQQVLYVAAQNKEERETQKAEAQHSLAAWFSAHLSPLHSWLEQYDRLLICPDALLNTLPFACLYDSTCGLYLTETHEVSVVPGLAVWTMLPSAPAISGDLLKQELLILGSSSMDGERDRLPRAVQEACEIARLFPEATLLTEQDATFARFAQTSALARLIYIAAHGEYCFGEPSASFVEFVDQPLRVRDILRLKLTGAIVVLSACETNKGYLTGNESMGLVRAFLYAGASTVVATHWPVEDDATFSLMSSLMQKVRKGESFPAALRAAQREFIHGQDHRRSHPVFWGAITVVGAKE